MKVSISTARPIVAGLAKTALVAVLATALLGSGLAVGVPEAQAATKKRLSRTEQARLERYRRHLAKQTAAQSAKAARYARHTAKKAGRPTVTRPLPPGWRTAKVSWYGPGFYGRGMAGGGKLQIASMIVAHKSLPFGTKVQFYYNGKTVTVPVKDRGPYVRGREFDLGPGTARYLGMMGVGTVQYRIVSNG